MHHRRSLTASLSIIAQCVGEACVTLHASWWNVTQDASGWVQHAGRFTFVASRLLRHVCCVTLGASGWSVLLVASHTMRHVGYVAPFASRRMRQATHSCTRQ